MTKRLFRTPLTLGDAVLDANTINRKTYAKKRIVRSYSQWTDLFPAEQRILSNHDRHFRGDVLDIAIGTGRTTRALLPRAQSYVGLDFSEQMIAAARVAFPEAELHCTDMRSVPALFNDRRFDAILISFNGIDYISWEDRNELLKSLRGLLREDGILVFSTHNLEMADEARGFKVREDLLPYLGLMRSDPIQFCKRAIKAPIWSLKAWRNHRRNRANEKFFDGYAYLNDIGEDFGLLTVYSAPDTQVQVLRESGYRQVQILQPWLKKVPAAFNYFVCSSPMDGTPAL